MINKALFTSNKDDWGTPENLFNELNNKYHFTVDVASNDQNHKCNRYYTIKEDGLKQDWSNEIVWCNPPYGREIGQWIKKAYESKNTKSVFLIPARTDTKWFHNYIYKKDNIKVEFLKGRLKFEGEGLKNSAPFPSMLVYFYFDER
jgi:site-specific DNA-methyltransferase (adenine-specific)